VKTSLGANPNYNNGQEYSFALAVERLWEWAQAHGLIPAGP
jgi:hypothetical protein